LRCGMRSATGSCWRGIASASSRSTLPSSTATWSSRPRSGRSSSWACRGDPDPQAAADYLAFGYVPGESTGLLDIRSLEPGTALLWEDRGSRIVRFASIEPEQAQLEETFAEAVRLHLRSDVPLAVLLLGWA
jgi:asparagine synthetase B (glutamine-hydrolysing)